MESRYRWVAWLFIACALFTAALLGVLSFLPGGANVPATFQVVPQEITLCTGQGRQFRAVHEGAAVEKVKWDATGGDIGPGGFYVAPGIPGDYQVTAQHPKTTYQAAALVRVTECTTRTAAGSDREGLPTSLPSPPTLPAPATPFPRTPTPSATAEAPTGVPTPSLMPVAPAASDASDDLVTYAGFEPVAAPPPGSDIRLACFGPDLQLLRAMPDPLAAEVPQWADANYLVLWMELHQPIPETIDRERYWLFALDTDNNAATGRPVGGGPINPDMGPEITVGIQSNPLLEGAFEPYLYVWNDEANDFEQHPVSGQVYVSTARDAIAVRVPADLLVASIRELSQVEPDWENTIGRAAAIVVTDAGEVIDFCPERP